MFCPQEVTDLIPTQTWTGLKTSLSRAQEPSETVANLKEAPGLWLFINKEEKGLNYKKLKQKKQKLKLEEKFSPEDNKWVELKI